MLGYVLRKRVLKDSTIKGKIFFPWRSTEKAFGIILKEWAPYGSIFFSLKIAPMRKENNVNGK